jgi:hypothetical protein
MILAHDVVLLGSIIDGWMYTNDAWGNPRLRRTLVKVVAVVAVGKQEAQAAIQVHEALEWDLGSD